MIDEEKLQDLRIPGPDVPGSSAERVPGGLDPAQPCLGDLRAGHPSSELDGVRIHRERDELVAHARAPVLDAIRRRHLGGVYLEPCWHVVTVSHSTASVKHPL